MRKCKFCNEKAWSESHGKRCWMNPQNMKIVMRLIADQIIDKSSFSHLHFAINVKPIDVELRKLKMTSMKTILAKLNLDKKTPEEKLYYFIHFVVENKMWDPDSFPPPLLYMIDGWHCFGEEGQEKVDKAIEIENFLMYGL